MNQLRKIVLVSLIFLLSFSSLSLAAPHTISDANGHIVVEGLRQGNQVKLSLSYQNLSADFTGFQAEIQLPEQLDEKSGIFNADNTVIQSSAADNYDTTTNLYKLVVLSPELSSQPQGRSGKIGDITFHYKAGQERDELSFMLKSIRVYGGWNPIISKQNEEFQMSGSVPSEELQLFIDKNTELAEPGEVFSLVIKAEADDLYGFDIYLDYNPALVQLEGSPNLHGDFGVLNHTASLFYSDQDGKMRIIGTRLAVEQGVNGKVGLVELKFKAKDGHGLSRFVIGQGSKFSDSNGGIQSPAADYAGSVALANPDINGDGHLAVNDLIRIAQANGKASADSGFDERLDMNLDGKINVLDIAYVAYKLLK
ncbi:cohesin domain-containing protein [Paenibacillus sp. HWE-109]|uniref:cohesin domain-containing protein n=1 Tax=Paenibacillus sp. HWE-109 TaxID=1306526 RepID=UPI001EE09F0F|nr:cohesin domain-containing protein [Paenibacillus sp. HWE-109]UKS28116.1 cohesin domain-containing protein [Paenibacillus sp. HWE-109]